MSLCSYRSWSNKLPLSERSQDHCHDLYPCRPQEKGPGGAWIQGEWIAKRSSDVMAKALEWRHDSNSDKQTKMADNLKLSSNAKPVFRKLFSWRKTSSTLPLFHSQQAHVVWLSPGSTHLNSGFTETSRGLLFKALGKSKLGVPCYSLMDLIFIQRWMDTDDLRTTFSLVSRVQRSLCPIASG